MYVRTGPGAAHSAAGAQGTMSASDALLHLKLTPFDDLGFAKVDHHRSLRQGTSEVIYGAGKTPEQIAAIAQNMLQHGQKSVLITRMTREAADWVGAQLDLHYDPQSRIGRIGPLPEPGGIGTVGGAHRRHQRPARGRRGRPDGGISGQPVERLYDVGVAGIHRLLAHADTIMRATVIVAIAGMEGAIASVVGGLADCPVIAVPTSVGYGASFGGLAALLSMLNSCASGVSVVNIDNGFGAGIWPT